MIFKPYSVKYLQNIRIINMCVGIIEIIIINRMKYWKIIFLFFFALATLANANCPDNCEQCEQTGAMCFACKPNFQTSVMGGCNEVVIQNCVLFGPTQECFRCQPLFTVTQDGICEKNYIGCLNEGAPGQCLECGFGTSLMDGKCVGVLNCDAINAKGTCSKCIDGFSLTGGICKDTSKGCSQVRKQDGSCKKCAKGYFMSGYKCYQQNKKIPNCYIQSSDSQCKVCKSGYNQVGPKCLLNRQMGGPNGPTDGPHDQFQDGSGSSVQTVHIQNCQTPDNNGGCSVCTYGFFPKDNICVQASNLCDGYNIQTGACFACKFGLTLDPNGDCMDKNCLTPSQDKCQSCKQGFKPDENGVCRQFDPNCITSFNGRCQSCSPSFYADKAGKCKPLPQNCITPNIETGACLECVKDYEILAPGNPCTKKIVIQNCQVPDQKNPGKCLICIERYFPDGNKCSKVSDQCKDYNPQNGRCTTCSIAGYVLDDGKCVDPNCMVKNNEICSSCKPNFIYSNGEKICKYNDPNCKNLGTTSCKQCRDGYYQSIQNNCQILPQNCKLSDPSGACTLCISGFELNQRNCVKTVTVVSNPTQTSTNSNTSNGKFQQKQGSNVQSGSDLNCREYSNGRCVKCSNRYYVGSEGKCVPVNPLCKQSNQMGECTACYPGYQVDSGKCVIGKPADSNCKTFSGQVCTECYKGFYYNADSRICKKVNALCKTSISSGACTSCYPGYSLNQMNGNCEVSIKDPNCRSFNSDGSCSSCSSRYYVNPNGKCGSVNPLCKDYNPLSGACTVCYPGYGLSGNSCVQGLSQDPNCKTFQGSNCQDCVSGFYIGSDNKCKQASPLCKTFDPRSGACLSCYNGYEVSSGTCIIAKSQDPNCKKYQNNYCVACYQGFIAINGKCMTQNPLCKSLDMNNGGCLSCWPGYTISDNTCVLQKASSPNSDPFCVKMGTDYCIQCSNGYYYSQNDRTCQQLDPICKTHDMTNGFCASCYDGYNLVEKKCVQAQVLQIPNCSTVGSNGLCVECDQGYYLSMNNMCKPISAYCKNVDKYTQKCTQCKVGYFFQDNDCIYPALYDYNCERYESSYCSRCRRGFYISNYACLAVDQNCIDFNDKTNQCMACANNMQPIGNTCA